MIQYKRQFLFTLLALLAVAGQGCSSESGDLSDSSGQQDNASLDTTVIQKMDPVEYVEPLFMIDNGNLTVNGVALVFNESSIETLAEALGPWEFTFSNAAYTNYAWEAYGLYAQVGYTKNVQHIMLLNDPTGHNETWGMEMSPFQGMVIVDGYLISSEVTMAELQAVLDYEVDQGSLGYDIESSPCEVNVILSESGQGLRRIWLSGS